MRKTWDAYYMGIAEEVATRSNCIKRQVGAVIVVDNRIVATGYNGTPRNVQNCNEGGCARCSDKTIQSGTRLDECWCSHAEENAIVQCAFVGVAVRGGVLYSTFAPCTTCSKIIINSGIRVLKYLEEYPGATYNLLISGHVQVSKVTRIP